MSNPRKEIWLDILYRAWHRPNLAEIMKILPPPIPTKDKPNE